MFVRDGALGSRAFEKRGGLSKCQVWRLSVKIENRWHPPINEVCTSDEVGDVERAATGEIRKDARIGQDIASGGGNFSFLPPQKKPSTMLNFIKTLFSAIH